MSLSFYIYYIRSGFKLINNDMNSNNKFFEKENDDDYEWTFGAERRDIGI